VPISLTIWEHGQRVLPRYAARCRRYRTQWQRHWAALLQHRLPEALYGALEAIAATEHRTLGEQITTMLREGVGHGQAQDPQHKRAHRASPPQGAEKPHTRTTIWP